MQDASEILALYQPQHAKSRFRLDDQPGASPDTADLLREIDRDLVAV